MNDNALYNGDVSEDDQQILRQVSERIAIEIPEECREGVVRNVRLIQSHIDTMRGAGV